MQQLATRELTSGQDTWARWTSAWAVASLPGVCLAVLAWGTVPVIITSAAMTALVALTLVSSGSYERLRVGWVAEVAVGAAILLVSISVLGAVLPLAAQIVVILGVATSPPLGAVREWIVQQLLP